MDWIGAGFDALAGLAAAVLPDGPLQELIAQGVVGGVGAAVVFLPQICLLFFLIALLEDTGYLARAAFVVDRLVRPFGLPGHSFVPLLSSHACALPGIMATRAIPDRRERLATILVAPFMTCSARLPVYVLVTLVLFPNRPALAALAFVGCYALGIVAGVGSALVARRTILRGKSRPMALELPTYKRPSVRTALLTTYDRALVFLKKAGTNIMAICIVLWWLGAYPHTAPPARAVELREQAAALAPADPARDGLESEADRLTRQSAKAGSFAGRIGKAIQPVFAPLGYDWQLTVGVVTSFAAREVFVSTMAVVVAGEEDAESQGVLDKIAAARRDDGSPLFTPAVGWSLLVYYVLAMQCLPTLAVTAKEAGGVKWALLQLAWMSVVAYVAAMAVYQVLR
jgi:ferrous iron transport protein B